MAEAASYGPQAERDYIDWLGDDPAKLRRYIEVHRQSPHLWHRAGVVYAEEKLENFATERWLSE